MQVVAVCSQYLRYNGIVRVLLTVSSEPKSQDEHLLCNLLETRGRLVPGKTYRVTIEEVPAT